MRVKFAKLTEYMQILHSLYLDIVFSDMRYQFYLHYLNNMFSTSSSQKKDLWGPLGQFYYDDPGRTPQLGISFFRYELCFV